VLLHTPVAATHRTIAVAVGFCHAGVYLRTYLCV
jgi:hypothetical protein